MSKFCDLISKVAEIEKEKVIVKNQIAEKRRHVDSLTTAIADAEKGLEILRRANEKLSTQKQDLVSKPTTAECIREIRDKIYKNKSEMEDLQDRLTGLSGSREKITVEIHKLEAKQDGFDLAISKTKMFQAFDEYNAAAEGFAQIVRNVLESEKKYLEKGGMYGELSRALHPSSVNGCFLSIPRLTTDEERAQKVPLFFFLNGQANVFHG
jgi:chromosome segregation ATPase